MKEFKEIKKINYEGKGSKNPFAFKFYNPEEIIYGKKMQDHLKFAMSYWHTLDYAGSDMFGGPSGDKSWNFKEKNINYKKRADIAFEIMNKLGIEYYCFHDADIAPMGNSPKEYVKNMNEMVDYLLSLQRKYNKKLLWATANNFGDKVFMAGAATSPNADVFAYSALKAGFKGDFYIEPKPKEPTKHQYDFDASTACNFLRTYGLLNDFKLNIEANHATLAGHTFEHELRIARVNKVFGSIDANQGDMLLGWDTDQFPTNIYETTLAMYEVLKEGGFKNGGLNFDAKNGFIRFRFKKCCKNYRR